VKGILYRLSAANLVASGGNESSAASDLSVTVGAPNLTLFHLKKDLRPTVTTNYHVGDIVRLSVFDMIEVKTSWVRLSAIDTCLVLQIGVELLPDLLPASLVECPVLSFVVKIVDLSSRERTGATICLSSVWVLLASIKGVKW